MKILCENCGGSEFKMPLWVKATFCFNENGTIDIKHVQSKESLEEKLTNHMKPKPLIRCKRCDSPAKIIFNEYEEIEVKNNEFAALEGR